MLLCTHGLRVSMNNIPFPWDMLLLTMLDLCDNNGSKLWRVECL